MSSGPASVPETPSIVTPNALERGTLRGDEAHAGFRVEQERDDSDRREQQQEQSGDQQALAH